MVAVAASAPPADAQPSAGAVGVVRPPMAGRSGAGIVDALTTMRVDAHLTYFGGPVVSHIRVVQVLWGEGDYLANVRQTKSPSMATFYQQILNSAYVDWLSEYDTPTQTIGRGEFVGQFLITPVNPGPTINDSEVTDELARQIAAGHVPAPDANIYYAVYFPAGVTVHAFNATTCVDACGWHGPASTAAGVLRYSVHPDVRGTCPCHGHHGDFADMMSVASHEMVETMTDPDVGISTSWYDIQAPASEGGEISDICNFDQLPFVGSDGVTYTVQTAWSNALGACIASKSAACGDGMLGPNEECDDGNTDPGDGCSPVCTIETGPCPPWHFVADVSVPVSFFSVPGDPGRASGAQVAPDGSILVSKDIGGNRWAITLDVLSGTLTGNVFASATGDAQFLYCEPLGAAEWRCLATSSCRTSGRESSIQATPDDAGGVLVSKNVGTQRWAIVRARPDVAVTGNVYEGTEMPPEFLYCVPVAPGSGTLDCFGSDACTTPGTDCASQWRFVARVSDLPADFFSVPTE